MAKCSLLLLWWLWLLPGYDGLSGLTGFIRVSADLAGTALTLPSWCVIHKRFNMSQAGFIERWCLNNVLAEVSSGADGSAVSCACTCATLNAVTVPVAT
jgi:hypothetical protein